MPGGELIVEGEATRQFPVFVLRPEAQGGGPVTLRVSDDQGFADEVLIEFLAGSRPAVDTRAQARNRGGGEA